VFAPEAVAWEQPNDRAGAEYRRRVRIISRGLTAVWRRRQLLNPLRHGSYAPMLFTHKVARRLIFVPMLVALFASWQARRAGIAWRLLGLGQIAFYATAAVATFAPQHPVGRNKLAGAAGHFCAANVAAAHAVLNVVRRRRFVVWEPQRA
jgi:hypothetical protein